MEIDYLDVYGLRSRGRVAESAPVQSTEWVRPDKAWTKRNTNGEWYVYWEGPGKQIGARAGVDKILTEFMALEDANPEQVARYVEKWGPLGLCKHGLPNTHLPRRMWSDLAQINAAPCEVLRARPPGSIGEPIERWRHFSGQANALHRAARHIQAGEPVPPELLEEKLSDFVPPGMFITHQVVMRSPSDPSESRPFDRLTNEEKYGIVAGALQGWLNFGDVGIHVAWDEGRWSLRFGGTGLAGAIALQLALTCTGTGSFVVCSGCSLPYPPSRKPRSGEGHYCDDCRDKGVPNRDSQRRFRERKRRQETE